MAEITLTKSQQAVVDNRGGPLLVSAAAGSGKTKVLVDRLLKRICDPDHPCNIDDFLVITYTNAAAAELRLKIAQALNARLSQEPDNRHLQNQLRRIYMADISTVHAFCSNLLRTYAYLLDIPADFRMAEEVESAMLQERVLDQLLQQSYEDPTDEFLAMVDMFGYGRDDRRLPEAIQMAYRAMRCRVNMKAWLDEMIRIMDISQYQNVSETPWGQYLMEEFHRFLSVQIRNMKNALREMEAYPNIQKAYGKTFEKNVEQMEELLAFTTWDELVTHKISSFGRNGAVKSPEDVHVKERLASVRSQCWEELKTWEASFVGTSEEILRNLKEIMPASQALLHFTEAFDQAYTTEKRHRKIMDFSDLEHTAIRLLVDRYTGQPTKIAREVSKKYVEIMVDEYQDSNQVQDIIFEAVSRNGQNRFMVGDVKQSIYRFRLADPTLFLDKYEHYAFYTEAKDDEPRKILLSENFRSRPEILSACNDVFRLIMRKQVGDLDYGEDEALHPGRTFAPPSEPPVELHCLTRTIGDAGIDKREMEAQYVAQRIRQLLDTPLMVAEGDGQRPVRPNDIVILMRSLANTAPIYMKALEEQGIAAVCSREGSLLDSSEIQILVAMLQVIDNPHRDVPLLTVLASPVFALTPDQLAQAKVRHKSLDVYDVIQEAGGPFLPFLHCLEQLRNNALWYTLNELVDQIFVQTALLPVFSAMHDGEKRERNLKAFRSFVVSFEGNGSRSLPELLWYLEDLKARGGDLPVPAGNAENAVTIMSVHKSKGLEFPVVFLSDLSHQFSRKDMQEAILVDDQFAVGCNYVDQARYVRYPTIAKQSIERKKRQEAISEELRILYVAMTRAKEKLIMTYYSRYLNRELETLNSQLTDPISDELCSSVNNPGKWILMAALFRTEAGALLNLVGGNSVSQVQEYPWAISYHDLPADSATPEFHVSEEASKTPYQDDPAQLDLLQYHYAHSYVSSLPSKITATTLKGRFQDREAAENAGEVKGILPEFQFKKAQFIKKGMTAAEKGIATHLFMQYASYSACTSAVTLTQELLHLVRDDFLTQEQADAVQQDQILQFFASDLGRWLLSQKTVRREFKFSVFTDAGNYDERAAGEQVMLQGVVDCFVIEPDGITILDFKTDRISGSVEARAEHYRPQMEAYADALNRIYELPIKEKILYFFSCHTEYHLS